MQNCGNNGTDYFLVCEEELISIQDLCDPTTSMQLNPCPAWLIKETQCGFQDCLCPIMNIYSLFLYLYLFLFRNYVCCPEGSSNLPCSEKGKFRSCRSGQRVPYVKTSISGQGDQACDGVLTPAIPG